MLKKRNLVIFVVFIIVVYFSFIIICVLLNKKNILLKFFLLNVSFKWLYDSDEYLIFFKVVFEMIFCFCKYFMDFIDG